MSGPQAGSRPQPPGGGQPTFANDGRRWRSVSTFSSLSSAWLRLAANAATGNGGTCFGDSGGPNFVGAGTQETGVVASISITGDSMCRSRNDTLRIDTPAARRFLRDFVSVP